jgi:phosphomevalonate kinase
MNGKLASVTVPGKLMLLGEYSVRRGGAALVMAVNRYLRVGRLDSRLAEDARVKQLRNLLSRLLGVSSRHGLWADSSAMCCKMGKLGLGSSAALVVGVALELLRENRRECPDLPSRLRLWPHLVEAHNRFQNFRGSGADVAACLLGGVIMVLPLAAQVRRLTLPSGLHLVFCYSGASASTPALCSAVDSWCRVRSRQASALFLRMEGLTQSARVAPAGKFVRIVDEYAECLAELDRNSGAGIFSPGLRELRRLARRLGGAAKPSGAGGGDMALAAFTSSRAASLFRRASLELGFAPLRLRRGVTGARIIEQEVV